jgi:hypothetical protein
LYHISHYLQPFLSHESISASFSYFHDSSIPVQVSPPYVGTDLYKLMEYLELLARAFSLRNGSKSIKPSNSNTQTGLFLPSNHRYSKWHSMSFLLSDKLKYAAHSYNIYQKPNFCPLTHSASKLQNVP